MSYTKYEYERLCTLKYNNCRWNSMHVMLDNYLENDRNLFKYLINCGFICYNFVQTEWHYSRKISITCSLPRMSEEKL